MIQYIIAAGIGAFLGSQSKKSKKSYAEGGGVSKTYEFQDFAMVFSDGSKGRDLTFFGRGTSAEEAWEDALNGNIEDFNAWDEDEMEILRQWREDGKYSMPQFKFEYYAHGGEVKEEDYLWNMDGNKYIVNSISGDMVFLDGYKSSNIPFSKAEIKMLFTKTPPNFAKGGSTYAEGGKTQEIGKYPFYVLLERFGIVGAFNSEKDAKAYIKHEVELIYEGMPNERKKERAEARKEYRIISREEAKKYTGYIVRNIDEEVGSSYAHGGEVSKYKTGITKYGKNQYAVRVDIGDKELIPKLLYDRWDSKAEAEAFAKRLAKRNNGTYVGEDGLFAKGGEVKMKHLKSHYKNLPSYSGYKWRGFSNGKHSFVKKDVKGYIEIEALEEDLTNGNIEFMAENDLSNTNRYYAKGGKLIGFTNDPIYTKNDISVQRIGGSTMWNVAYKGETKGRVLDAFTKEQAVRKFEKTKDDYFAKGGKTRKKRKK